MTTDSEEIRGYVDLLDACRNGDIESAKKILLQQPNLTERGGIVRAAVESRDADLVRFLFQKGAGHDDWEYTGDSDEFEHYWESSLVTACQKGPAETVRVLIEYGADVNEVGNRGETPLGTAALCGRAEVCKLLLESGANPIGRFRAGQSLLHYAAMSGDAQTLETLLPFVSDSEDLSMPDDSGGTPLHYAVFAGEAGALRALLLKGADANAVSKTGNTPLHLSAEIGNPETVTMLIDHGASINARNSHGSTPLDVAIATRRHEVRLQDRPEVKSRYDEVVEILKSHGGKYSLKRKLWDDLRRS